MKLTKLQQYILLASGGLIAFLFCYYQFLWSPMHASILQNQKILAQKQAQLSQAKLLMTQFASFKAKQRLIERRLEWFKQHLPTSVTRQQLFDTVNNLCGQSGVVLNNLNFSVNIPEITSPSYQWKSVQLQFNGDFNQLLSFIYSTIRSQLFLTLSGLQISTQTDPNNATITLTAQIYLNAAEFK